MRFSLTKREQRTLLIVLPLTVVVGWAYWMLVSYLAREAARLDLSLKTQQSQLAILERVTNQEETLRKRRGELEDAIKAYRTVLPNEEELPNVMQFLSDTASQTNVTIQAIFPQKGTEDKDKGKDDKDKKEAAPVGYKQVPIQIDAVAGYHQLGTFLSHVESSPHPVQVISLKVSENPKDPKRHLVRLVIQTYVIPKTEQPAAIR